MRAAELTLELVLWGRISYKWSNDTTANSSLTRDAASLIPTSVKVTVMPLLKTEKKWTYRPLSTVVFLISQAVTQNTQMWRRPNDNPGLLREPLASLNQLGQADQ